MRHAVNAPRRFVSVVRDSCWMSPTRNTSLLTIENPDKTSTFSNVYASLHIQSHPVVALRVESTIDHVRCMRKTTSQVLLAQLTSTTRGGGRVDL
jgi:hypothetical protein